MSNPSPVTPERIEYLQRRRTRLAFIQSMFFLFWQVQFFANEAPTPDRQAVYHLKLAAYVVWAGILLAFLATGGSWWSPKAVRAVLNDEVTRAHRLQALAFGFYASMATAVVCYAVNLLQPMSGRVAIHLILSLGIGPALLWFGILERRAQDAG
jgi:hypothetical protein